ncbi:MAG TPA: M14 metallopeptidase family protein, partial [Blastocatellia bacterium]|nr:M14 metallopeptidase family protein [Blastocatellia bacterium]
MFSRRAGITLILTAVLLSLPSGVQRRTQATGVQLQTPEQFLGFRVGEDRKLARWDKIVEYLKLVDAASDRVNLRELGKTTLNNPFIALEISSSDTIRNLGRYKELERKLYFQGGAPSAPERDEIFRSGKAVVLVTCNIHSTEIGASQMVLELVHRLATEDSPTVKKILDNVIFLLVPSLNPDGQIMVTDWYNKNVGSEYEVSPLPWLYHHYIGHDNNRDMYMFTQKESRLTARLLWRDWFPSVWLDEHQMGSSGARIFVMPATDPINPNVHPLIYRWNGIFGQAQAAALEAEGKDGIIYNSTYTNFWQGAMAWSGWWHNQVGLLTEVASARVASPIEQRRAQPGQSPPAASEDFRAQARRQMENPNEPLPPPRDTTPRTEYPRPWLGGRWTLRDIVDYELIATMALLETAADRREQLLKQIYEINRATVEKGVQGDVAAILINAQTQHDPRAVRHLIEKLQLAGVEVSRAESEFEADGRKYPSGTYVVPMNQVFARYAKDLLEKQTYPEVRRSPGSPPAPPYDVTAWSLGMLMGVETVFVKKPLPNGLRFDKVAESSPAVMSADGKASATYNGADDAVTINRWLKSGTAVTIAAIQRDGTISSSMAAADANLLSKTKPKAYFIVPSAPRIGFYQPWTSNMDEGWTRWVLEQYEFPYTTIHNAEIKAGRLREKFDVVLLADQSPNDILEGNSFKTIRQEYRGGIGEDGLEALRK